VRSVEVRLLRSAAPFEAPVLDLECGDGHFAAAVGCGFDVGLDPDAASMPFGNRTFGTIVANSTLEHVESLDAVIREAARVLRPGGRLVMTVTSHRCGDMLAVPTVAVRLGLRALAARYVGWFNTRSRHVTTEGPGQWRRRLDAQGLRVTRSEYYLSARAHRLFDVLHYAALPNLAARSLTGRWVVPPLGWAGALPARWMEEIVAGGRDGHEGPYALLIAERR